MDFIISILNPIYPVFQLKQADTGIPYFEENRMNNAVLKKAIVNVIGIVGVAAFSNFLQAASFDCAKASNKIEKMICADENLSALDEQLSTVYKKGLESSGNKDSFKKEQLAWLKTRNTCGDVACLAKSYQTRVNALGQSTTEHSPKSVITFTLVEGEGYPLCKEYVEMLNKVQYTEIPACWPKILPEFKNFQEINWVEMTDKELIKKVLEEIATVKSALNPTISKQVYSQHNTIKNINEDRSKMFSYEIILNDDEVKDFVYRVQTYSNYNRKKKYGHCEVSNDFYVNDSKITLDSIGGYSRDPYGSFAINGSRELFIYGGNLYASIYSGKTYYRVNFEVYGVGNKKMCGILAK